MACASGSCPASASTRAALSVRGAGSGVGAGVWDSRVPSPPTRSAARSDLPLAVGLPTCRQADSPAGGGEDSTSPPEGEVAADSRRESRRVGGKAKEEPYPPPAPLRGATSPSRGEVKTWSLL